MARFDRYAVDSTGSKSANVDGSVTPVVFKLQCGDGEKSLSIHRLMATVRDTGSFDSGSYGNGISMANGITMAIYNEDDSVKLDLLDSLPIKLNTDWTRVSYDATVSDYGVGIESLGARWTFTAAGGPLSISHGEYLGVTINDDLTGLTDHNFLFQGQVSG